MLTFSEKKCRYIADFSAKPCNRAHPIIDGITGLTG
jgi:hypothetical protein